MRSVVTVLGAVALLTLVVSAARADEANMSASVRRKTTSAHVALVGHPPSGARVESVLTGPRGAMARTKRGSGWLLHYGTERDNCARADATSGLRIMCVAW